MKPKCYREPRDPDEMSLMEAIFTDAVEDPRLQDGVDEELVMMMKTKETWILPKGGI